MNRTTEAACRTDAVGTACVPEAGAQELMKALTKDEPLSRRNPERLMAAMAASLLNRFRAITQRRPSTGLGPSHSSADCDLT